MKTLLLRRAKPCIFAYLLLCLALPSWSQGSPEERAKRDSLPPVIMQQFELNNKPGTLLIEWTTERENDNAYFTVLKSVDGVHFKELGSQDGTGRSIKAHYYKMEDLNPVIGKSYYRLLQTNREGVTRLIETKEIFREGNDRLAKDEFPNSIQKGSSIQLNDFNAITGTSQVNIINSNGEIVYTYYLTEKEIKGSFAVRIPSHLPNGVYELQYIDMNQLQSYSQKINVY